MAFDVKDYLETSDGSRPETQALQEDLAKKLPLVAFRILQGGDVLDVTSTIVPDAKEHAKQYIGTHIVVRLKRSDAQLQRIVDDITHQLQANSILSKRLTLSKPIDIDVVTSTKALYKLGYPRSIAQHAAGVFWDHPDWDRARIGLRQDQLSTLPALVFHEFAHAIHYLAFTQSERELIYRLLRPSFGSRAAMDEVFAIYSERELAGAFNDSAKQAPGVYGATRRLWNEDHVFTRFVRKLYLPHKALAGPRLGGIGAGDWMKKLAR